MHPPIAVSASTHTTPIPPAILRAPPPLTAQATPSTSPVTRTLDASVPAVTHGRAPGARLARSNIMATQIAVSAPLVTLATTPTAPVFALTPKIAVDTRRPFLVCFPTVNVRVTPPPLGMARIAANAPPRMTRRRTVLSARLGLRESIPPATVLARARETATTTRLLAEYLATTTLAVPARAVITGMEERAAIAP